MLHKKWRKGYGKYLKRDETGSSTCDRILLATADSFLDTVLSQNIITLIFLSPNPQMS